MVAVFAQNEKNKPEGNYFLTTIILNLKVIFWLSPKTWYVRVCLCVRSVRSVRGVCVCVCVSCLHMFPFFNTSLLLRVFHGFLHEARMSKSLKPFGLQGLQGSEVGEGWGRDECEEQGLKRHE